MDESLRDQILEDDTCEDLRFPDRGLSEEHEGPYFRSMYGRFVDALIFNSERFGGRATSGRRFD